MFIEPLVLGIYSKTVTAEAGQGGNTQKFTQKTYWFIRHTSEDEYEVAPLNADQLPSEVRSAISRMDFLKTYAPEIDYYKKNDCPFLRSLKIKIDAIHESLDEVKLNEQEINFCKNTFFYGKIASRMGRDHVTIKSGLEALFGESMVSKNVKVRQFNENAINLRKTKCYDESLRYYHDAMTLNDNDENIHFNIARVYFEVNDYECCIKHLSDALRINPSLNVAKKFLNYIDRKVDKIDERSKELLRGVSALG
jgi:tetratricopeptide (TPR) repeat protein